MVTDKKWQKNKPARRETGGRRFFRTVGADLGVSANRGQAHVVAFHMIEGLAGSFIRHEWIACRAQRLLG